MTGYLVFEIGMGIVFISLILVALFGKGDEGVSRGFWSITLIGCVVGIVGCLMILFA